MAAILALLSLVMASETTGQAWPQPQSVQTQSQPAAQPRHPNRLREPSRTAPPHRGIERTAQLPPNAIQPQALPQTQVFPKVNQPTAPMSQAAPIQPSLSPQLPQASAPIPPQSPPTPATLPTQTPPGQVPSAPPQQVPANGNPPPAEIATEVTDSLDTLAASVTLESIAAKEKELASNSELPEEEKQRVTKLYAKAKSSLERAAFLNKRRVEFLGLIESATQRAATLRTDIEQARLAQPAAPNETGIPELESRLQSEQEWLRQLKDRHLQLVERLNKQSARQNELRQRLADIDTEITTTREQAKAADVTDTNPLIAAAISQETYCHLHVLNIEEPTVQAELQLYDTEDSLKLLQSERSLLAIQIDGGTKQVQLTNDALQIARENVASTTLAKTEEAAHDVPALLRPIAEQNRVWAGENKKLTQVIHQVERRKKQVETQLDTLRNSFTSTRNKVDTIGLSASIGAILRNQRSTLPDVRSLRSHTQSRIGVIHDTQLRIFDLDEAAAKLVNLRDEAKRTVRQLSDDPVDQTTIQVAETLLSNRTEIIDSLLGNEKNYFAALTGASIAEEELSQLSLDFREYIEERVLWIRSHPEMTNRLSGNDWQTEKAAVSIWKTAPVLFTETLGDLRREPLAYFTWAFFVIVLIIAKPVFSARLKRIAETVRSSAYRQFAPSLAALLINVLSSLVVPSILGFLGWRFRMFTTPLGVLLGGGLIMGAVVSLPIAFYRSAFAKNGVVDSHFDWSQSTIELMRNAIQRAGWLLIPLVIVSTTLSRLQATTSPGLAHRIVFVVTCILVISFIWRILHPRNGLPATFLAAHAGGWVDRLQTIWFWGLLSIPAALSVMSISGYSYTAKELAWRGFVSVTIVAMLCILHGLIMRALLVHRRRLAVDRARQRYAEFQELRKQRTESQSQSNAVKGSEAQRVIAQLPGVNVTSDGIVIEDDPLAELRENTEQSRRLASALIVGAAILMLWMTWHHVLPALSFLENWPLWNSTREVAEVITTESGAIQTRTREVVDPVTITDVSLALFVAVLGFIASRNLPGMLELLVLQRLPLEKSVRYAITTISSYVAVAIGLFVAFRLVGLRWNQIQWMATALTFGLAFGLQEMFANFVAGIILLFERPIRVGDIVTVDDVTGVVSRVRMRATTVTNFDRKDYIVPNKDFITGRLLNWTLSDHVNRVTIEVGVAYEMDTELAKSILVRIAEEHAIVENDPPPMATFEEFGDSSLKIVLRCFIAMANMPMRLEVIDDLHTRIDSAFRAANIEIAYPRQDLSIREMPSGTRAA